MSKEYCIIDNWLDKVIITELTQRQSMKIRTELNDTYCNTEEEDRYSNGITKNYIKQLN